MVEKNLLERLEPPASRDITLTRFVPTAAIDHAWYERPYYLGPDAGAGAAYAALVAALAAVGVLARKGQSPSGQDYDDTAFIPVTTFAQKIQGGLYFVKAGAGANTAFFVYDKGVVAIDAKMTVDRERYSLFIVSPFRFISCTPSRQEWFQ